VAKAAGALTYLRPRARLVALWWPEWPIGRETAPGVPSLEDLRPGGRVSHNAALFLSGSLRRPIPTQW
jgi:hypothetical protein